jgi:dipeptidyl aminopeptidase/acylaminoacyl peptidase
MCENREEKTQSRDSVDWRSRYATIQLLLGRHDELVANGAVYPRWIEGRDIFWYERQTSNGTEYRIVDAHDGTNRLAFRFDTIAKALEDRFETGIDRDLLMLRGLQLFVEPDRATFEAYGMFFEFSGNGLKTAPKAHDRNWAKSPDGKWAVFNRDSNLWLREIAPGRERALTSDGTDTNAYGDKPAASRVLRTVLGGTPPEGLWSPDSKYFFTLQTDDRQVPDLVVTNFVPEKVLRPEVAANKTSLPSDPEITKFRVLAIDIATGRQIEAQHPPLSAVRMNDTPFAAGLAWWGKDSSTAYFVNIERGEKNAHLFAFDIATGETQVVFSERSETYVELSVIVYAPALVIPLPDSGEVIWYSERLGRGHLFLYDLLTGEMKKPITSGEWQVREVLHVDTARREIFLLAGGLEPGEDPYLTRPCLVGIDNGKLKVLSPAPGEHLVWRSNDFGLGSLAASGTDTRQISGMSPSGDFFVETVGEIDRLPETVLRARDGRQISIIERAEIRRLPKTWRWPEAVSLKAADGETSVYGLLFEPADYDPSKSYPVIDFIYGGPQISFVPKIAFADESATGTLLEAAAYAALGAFTLVLDGRGTACRERKFREASYGAIHTASNLEDHITAIRQLGARYPAMDLQRVGITGFSGGGYMTAIAALRFGDFFKVAVAGGGNYDQALFWHAWGERYHGPFEAEHYRVQAAKTYASGLQGKLLLIHGLMDSGCHPAALFQLIQALIEENKDFDLVVLPKARHEWTGYGTRRKLDYLTTHLFGATPPQDIKIALPYDGLLKRFAANAIPPEKSMQTRSAT